MAIEFKCSTCGKELFAQEQYAGMGTTCPGCKTKLIILPKGAPLVPVAPVPAATGAPVAAQPDSPPASSPSADAASAPVERAEIRVDPFLVDMENFKPPAPRPESPASEVVSTPVDNSEATKRCPYCAETIKAAARKRRFCGEFFDDDLKRQEALERRRKAVDAAMKSARGSETLVRGVSVVMTMLTSGWLMFLTLDCITLNTSPSFELTFSAAWPLYFFNVLLIGGLLMLIRQMKVGPYHVFLAAAVAIITCMPLDALIGLPLSGSEAKLAEIKSQGDMYKNLTVSDVYWVGIAFYSFAGVLVSIPVWFAALVIGVRERNINRMK